MLEQGCAPALMANPSVFDKYVNDVYPIMLLTVVETDYFAELWREF